MSTSWHFMKGRFPSLKEIEEKTSIRKHRNEEGKLFLELKGNYVLIGTDNDSSPISEFTCYASNNPSEILKELVRSFDLYFVSEYVMREQIESPPFITDEFLEEYRKGIVAEIQTEEEAARNSEKQNEK